MDAGNLFNGVFMYIGLAFWIIMLIWGVFGFVPGGRFRTNTGYVAIASIIEYILFFLVGWKLFGFALHS